MASAIIATLPPQNPDLNFSQKALIHKVVIGEALSAIEETMHTEQLNDQRYRSFFEQKSARVHRLPDQTFVFDQTVDRTIQLFNGILGQFSCQNQPIYFSSQEGEILTLHFSKAIATDFVVIKDGPGAYNMTIVETKIAGVEPKKTEWIFNRQTLLTLGNQKKHFFLASNAAASMASVNPAILAVVAAFPTGGIALTEKAIELIEKKITGEISMAEEARHQKYLNYPTYHTVYFAKKAGLPSDLSLAVEAANLIDKKVSGLSMSKREELAHLKLLGSSVAYRNLFEWKKGRVHTFSDQTVKLFNSTKNADVRIAYNNHFKIECIVLNGLWVLPLSSGEIQYSPYCRVAPSFIDYVVVRDGTESGWLEIEVVQMPNPESPAAKPFVNYIHLEETLDYGLLERGENSGQRCYQMQSAISFAVEPVLRKGSSSQNSEDDESMLTDVQEH